MTEQEYLLAADLRSVRIAVNALRYINTENSSVAMQDVTLVLHVLDRCAIRLAAAIDAHMERVEATS